MIYMRYIYDVKLMIWNNIINYLDLLMIQSLNSFTGLKLSEVNDKPLSILNIYILRFLTDPFTMFFINNFNFKLDQLFMNLSSFLKYDHFYYHKV